MEKISIRNAKFAKIGLHDFCKYVNKFKNTREMTILEIGSYVGDSTQIFANYFKKVIAIDPWENGYDENDQSSYKYPMAIIEAQFDGMRTNFQHIEKIKDKAENVVSKFADNSIDIVYVDGLHSYDGVINDIKDWYCKVKNGGWLAGHDYKNKHHPGVEKAVHEIVGLPEMRFGDTSWILPKKTIVTRGGLKL